MFKYCENNCEITMEINPNDINEEYLKKLKKTKINRISIGVQSFNDDILKTIGRQHSSLEAIRAIKKVVQAGFKNISLDFIYGLPNQTLSDFKNDLKLATNFDIMGNATYYSEKNIGTFLSLIISIVFISVIFIFAEYIIRSTKLRIDPRNVERSREGNIKYRNLLSNTMIWAEIVSLLLLTIGNLVLLQVIDMNIIIVSINLICMILLIGVLVIFIIKANKIRFNYKIEKDTVVQKDDDDKWIFGLIYYNKEDPRVNVEKRFGIGYTVNAGTPIGMAIYIGTVILLIAVLALSSVAK